MAATFKGQRKLPHYQGHQLGKKHAASDKSNVPETIIFSFSTKGEHSFHFPLVIGYITSLEHGIYFRHDALLLLWMETCPRSASAPLTMLPNTFYTRVQSIQYILFCHCLAVKTIIMFQFYSSDLNKSEFIITLNN